MSALENSALQVLKPLIAGTSSSLDVKQMTTIAAWAVKTAMMFEFTDTASQANHAPEHRWLAGNGTPPPGTQVWAAPLAITEDWGVRAQHYGMLWAEPGADTEQPCNTHQTTIGLGRLLLVVIRAPAELPSLFETIDVMIPMWPEPQPASWPHGRDLGDRMAWAVSQSLAAFLTPGALAD